MNSRLTFLLILTFLLRTGVHPVAAQQNEVKIALVIGNAAYADAEQPLKNPVNNARAMADELRRIGFEVDLGENLATEAMRAAITRFYGKIKPGSTALLFFSGYGIQSNRQTYMVPVNAQIWTEYELQRVGYSLDSLLAEMNSRGASTKIVILDASRRNPFESRFRSFSAGLAPVNVPPGTVVMYAAAPGAVVEDGDRPLFVTELLKEIHSPGRIDEAFNRTLIATSRASQGNQIPWVSSSLSDDFLFSPEARATPVPQIVEAERKHGTETADLEARPRADYQAAERAGTRKAWEDFVRKYPSGRYADLARDQVTRLAPAPSRPKPAPPVSTPGPGPAIDPFEQLRLTAQQYLKTVPARYNVPDYLTYGRSKEISFVLEPQGVGTGADRLADMPGQVVTAIVQVSPHVKALLTGPADLVEIKLRGGDDTQRKAVTLSAPVQWVWDVKAIGVGNAVLQLELISFVPNNEKDTSLQVSTFRRQIPIEISPMDRAKMFVAEISPLWAFLAALITTLGGIIAFFGWKPAFGRSQKKDES